MVRVAGVYKWLFCFTFFMSCFIANPVKGQALKANSQSKVVKEHLFDSSRKRDIPVAYYAGSTPVQQQLIIINHGYGVNAPNSYLNYSYLAEHLAAKGYLVVSIQHELPTDDLIPDVGKPQIVRRPFWERGVENIRFVIKELHEKYPKLDYQHIILIGHSNGGDMAMLFAHKYPREVYKVISLDNRRMALPRVSWPEVYTLRSSDYPADEGVLPTKAEQKKYRITVLPTPVSHNNMSDHASEEERKTLLKLIDKCLMQRYHEHSE